MARRVTFVTSNAHKLREVTELLAPFGIRVRGERRTLPEPQADRLEEVVRAKLAAIPIRRDPIVVEDSGIFFRGLRGFPGVYSAYAFRTLGLPGLLRAVDGRSRAAEFRTVAGLRSGRRSWLLSGSVRGALATRARGTGGFGYDPIFIPSGEDRTFAEMSAEEKHRYSHRGRAFRKVARQLAKL